MFLLYGFFFFFFLSFAYSQRSHIGCLPYFHTWCGLSANLECMCEMCCTRLDENTGRKKSAKKRHLRTIPQLCRAIFSQVRHVCIDNRKILVEQQCLLHISSQYGQLRPSSGWDRLAGLEHPSKFQQVSRLGFVTAATSFKGSQPNFARCLAACWASAHILVLNSVGAVTDLRNFNSCF